jgi:hypothetical protein
MDLILLRKLVRSANVSEGFEDHRNRHRDDDDRRHRDDDNRRHRDDDDDDDDRRGPHGPPHRFWRDRYDRHKPADLGLTVLKAVLYAVLLGLLGGAAAYLSWTSNTLIVWNTAWRVLFAVFAFLFGMSYLVTYVVCRLDMVLYIKRNCGMLPLPLPGY